MRALHTHKHLIFSSSTNDFRVWDLRPAPAQHWSFIAKEGRTYVPGVAADSGWRWLAVLFWCKDSKRGVEVRKVATGEVVDLEVPPPRTDVPPQTADMPPLDLPEKLSFSPDGKWLILMEEKSLWIYETEVWQFTAYSLPSSDGVFQDFAIHEATLYVEVAFTDHRKDPYAEVAWSGPGFREGKSGLPGSSSKTYDYLIELHEGQPTIARRGNLADETTYDDDADVEDARDEYKGWPLGSLYKYRSAGIISIHGTGWACHAKGRDHGLGASDCDVQFIPTDIDRLIKLYDPIIWKPSTEELEQWANGE